MRIAIRVSFVSCLMMGVLLAAAELPKKAAAPAAPAAITLAVDASQAPQKIFHARLTISAAPGPLTLLYPKWIPGEHGPTGPVVDLTGLEFSAGGHRISWRRDDVDMYTFHLEVPAGASAVDVTLDYVGHVAGEGGFRGGEPRRGGGGRKRFGRCPDDLGFKGAAVEEHGGDCRAGVGVPP